MTSVVEVRAYLNKMGKNRVHTDTIELNIRMAKIEVDMEKHADATPEVIDAAILADAGFKSYLAYATEFERSAGRVPVPMLEHLQELKEIAKRFRGYAKRGASNVAISPIMVLSESAKEWLNVAGTSSN